MMQEHHAYTFAHSLRVGILMAAYGRHLGLDDDHVKLMAETGLAHDVGKLRIPIDILAKPVRLTDAETAVMRTHRSEERRVGKVCVSTCRSRWSPYDVKRKKKDTTKTR